MSMKNISIEYHFQLEDKTVMAFPIELAQCFIRMDDQVPDDNFLGLQEKDREL